jgi:CSLREA domain-containing protein
MIHATALLRLLFLISLLLSLAGLVPVAAGSLSPQNTIQVNIEVDEYDTTGTGTGCSLREAIQAANIDAAFGGCTAGSGTDTITFQDSLDVITLSIPIVDDTLNATGDLNIESDLIIQGPGWQDLAISALGNNSRIFEISNASLDLDVTIQNVGLAYGDSGSYAGGAIFITESLLLDGVTLVHNHSDSNGGAITSVPDSENSSLTIRNCLFNDNSSEDGGGAIRNASPMIIVNSRIYYNETTDAINGRGGGLYSSGPTTISHTFIYHNRSGAEGGNLYFSTGSNIFLIEDSIIRAGITEYGNGGNVYVTANTIYEPSFTIRRTEISDGYAGDNMAPDQMGGGIFSDIGLTLENVTISGNWASTGGGIYSIEDAWPSVFNNITVAFNSHSTGSYGDGIYKAGTGAIQISNSIVSLNGEAGGCSGRECDCYTGGVYISAGNNLGRGTSCAFENTGDEQYDNPSIGPLSYNWGFSRTHELYFDSVAIDTGNNATCPTTDQRGWYRPVEGTDLDEPPVATCDKGAYEYGHRLEFLPMIRK